MIHDNYSPSNAFWHYLPRALRVAGKIAARVVGADGYGLRTPPSGAAIFPSNKRYQNALEGR